MLAGVLRPPRPNLVETARLHPVHDETIRCEKLDDAVSVFEGLQRPDPGIQLLLSQLQCCDALLPKGRDRRRLICHDKYLQDLEKHGRNDRGLWSLIRHYKVIHSSTSSWAIDTRARRE